MKNILILSVAILLLFSCKKNKVATIDAIDANEAQVKFGYWVANRNNPNTQIKIDDNRVSYNLTYAVSFPGGGANQGGSNTNDYLSIPAGKRKISLSTVKYLTNIDSTVLFTGSYDLVAGQKYSLMFVDSSNVKTALIPDNLTPVIPPNNTTAVCRFYHGLMNVGPVDVYFGTSTTPVFTNVAFNTATSTYANIGIGSTNIAIRPAGALPTSTSIITYAAAISGGRVYTAIGRGISGITLSTDIRRPQVSIVTNR